MLSSWIVASAGGTTLPDWPAERAEASLPVWPIIGLIILVVVIGVVLVKKR